MDKRTAAELVALAKQKNDSAIAALYEQNYNAVYFSIKAKIADEDTVLDLTQDTFLKAFDSLESLSDPANFTPWVKAIGANQALMYLRKKKPILFTELQPEGDEEERELNIAEDNVEASPEASLDRKETARLIREILGSLSENQRLAVGMFYYDQLSVKEIAEATGISEGSIKVHLSNGRKRIEEKVRALEKRGTKLYSLSPVPFLLWLLRSEAAAGTAVPALAAAGAVGAAAGTAAGSGSAAAATGAAAKTAGMSLAAKIAAGVTAAALVTGGAVAAVELPKRNMTPEQRYYSRYFQSSECQFYGNDMEFSLHVYDTGTQPEDYFNYYATQMEFIPGVYYAVRGYDDVNDSSSTIDLIVWDGTAYSTLQTVSNLSDITSGYYTYTVQESENSPEIPDFFDLDRFKAEIQFVGYDGACMQSVSEDYNVRDIACDSVHVSVKANGEHPEAEGWVYIDRETHKIVDFTYSYVNEQSRNVTVHWDAVAISEEALKSRIVQELDYRAQRTIKIDAADNALIFDLLRSAVSDIRSERLWQLDPAVIRQLGAYDPQAHLDPVGQARPVEELPYPAPPQASEPPEALSEPEAIP